MKPVFPMPMKFPDRHCLSPILRYALLLLWTTLILYLTLKTKPYDDTSPDDLLDFVVMAVKAYLPPDHADFIIAKTFHFGAYGLWVLLLAGAWTGGYFNRQTRQILIRVVIALILFAVMQEALQHLNPTRGASARDVCINIAGGLTALVIREAILRDRRIRAY